MHHGPLKVSPDHYEFSLWAPLAQQVDILLNPRGTEQKFPMEKDSQGWWKSRPLNCPPGTDYLFLLDSEQRRPDPASLLQRDTVHGPSVLVDRELVGDLARGKEEKTPWKNHEFQDYVLYELHVGTFTPEGTLDSACDKLDYLVDLGITAVELLPLAQFPGERNWGYDGVLPYAVQNSYGGPLALARFVSVCHQKGLAVVLDVVYNHFGPEGNYLSQFGPYFSDHYHTPWGGAVNYDGPYSEPVREYILGNALYWLELYGIDGLRLDAIHAIYDFGARHLLKEMEGRVRALSRKRSKPHYLIAESALNDRRVLDTWEKGGHGLRAQWLDDYHHCLHVHFTGETRGYYEDYQGLESLKRSLEGAFVLQGDYSPFLKRRHGGAALGLSPSCFVVFNQNHDMVGNRMLGDRLCHNLEEGPLQMLASLTILSPYVPLLFMGEEFAASTPFPYFVSHGDGHLNKLVEEGRKKEFEYFLDQGQPPVPHEEATFLSAKLDWKEATQGDHGQMRDWYRQLLAFRREHPALNRCEERQARMLGKDGLHLRVQGQGEILDLFWQLGPDSQSVEQEGDNLLLEPWTLQVWQGKDKVLDSHEKAKGEKGKP